MAHEEIADRYRRFAEHEARGWSETYVNWALGIAGDDEVLTALSALRAPKRQPNLLLATSRFLGCPIGPYENFRNWVLENWPRVTDGLGSRSTQTNEAARCAVLLPVLSRIDGPLALVEVGASAGLCLHPDLYSYRYRTETGTVGLDPAMGPSPVVIPCDIDEASVPERLPEIAWRAGIDLNPLDPGDPEARNWLRALVWPEQDERRARLDAALRIAAEHPVPIVRGDLVGDIEQLLVQAPEDARIVVFHSSVLAYPEPEVREQFARIMRSRPDVTWISNEAAAVLPRVADRLDGPTDGRTVIAVDEIPIALAGPHGQSYEALPAR